MKCIRQKTLVVLMTVAGVIQACGISAAEEDRWVVASVQGGAWKSSDRDPSVRTAVRPGDAVRSGDRLETFQRNKVVLTQDPAGRNILMAQGSFRVRQTPGATRVQLEQGRVLAVLDGLKGRGDFSVVTPTGVAAVRGTRFGVDALSSRMEVRTYEGEVLVRGNNTGRRRSGSASISLNKGRKTLLDSDADGTALAEDLAARDWRSYRESFETIRAARAALEEGGGRWFAESKEPSRARWVPSNAESGRDTGAEGKAIVF